MGGLGILITSSIWVLATSYNELRARIGSVAGYLMVRLIP